MHSDKKVEEGKGHREKSSNLWFPLLLIVVCIVIEFLSSRHLPQQRTLGGSVSTISSSVFSVANSRKNLVELTKFGPRVTGSSINEIAIPRYLSDKVRELAKGSPANVKIEVDQQNPSSNFYLDFLGGITNVYQNVTNLVVRVSWPGTDSAVKADDFSVLVNAHFDSIPGSPGAADDAVGIACMLEVLRILAHGPALKHPIVLLFNGAEEGNHQAAHGFITQHRWAPEVKYVLNLEAIGSGGQEMVFQCNSGWLANFYGKMAPHPHAAVIAHELFKNFLHRMASTDWSTLLKYGSPGIRGIDTAYIENGYVYHTSFDSQSIIPNGTLVNTGENILYLAKSLANSVEVPNFTQSDEEDQLAVFFDFLGVVFISYSGANVTIIHSLVAIVCISVMFALSRNVSNMTLTKLQKMFFAEMYCFFAPVLAAVVYGLLIFLLCPMRWYEGGLVTAVAIYLPPVLFTVLYVRGQANSEGVLNSPYIRIISGLLFPWLSGLLIGIYFGVMSVYACCLWIVSTLFAVAVFTVVRFYTLRFAQPPTRFLYSPEFFYILAFLPMLFQWVQIARLFLTMTVPLLGKSGTTVPTDPAIAALIGILVSGPAPLLLAHELDRPVITKRTTKMCAVGMGTILLVATFYLQPYSAQRPKRLWIQHLHRTIHQYPDHDIAHGLNPLISSLGSVIGGVAGSASGASGVGAPVKSKAMVKEDCGVWISAFDEQGMTPLQSLGVSRLDGRHKAATLCNVWNGDCYLQFPWYFSVSEVLRDSHYIPTACPSDILPAQQLKLLLSSVPVPPPADAGKHSADLRLVKISLHGPSHMHLILRDNSQGQRIVKWCIASHADSVPNSANKKALPADVVHMRVTSDAATGDVTSAQYVAATETAAAGTDKNTALRHLITPPAARAEGVHYLSVGFGLCSSTAGCHQDVYLLVRGSAAVQVAAYGHYTDQKEDSAEIKELIKELPDWSVGAEWTKFPSLLIQNAV